MAPPTRTTSTVPALTAASSSASKAPRAELLQDPRLPEVLARALRKFGMEEYFGYAVVKLVTGETDPRSVMCCNTGCHPCAKDYLGASEFVLKELRRKPRRFFFW
ncbi:MAG TPA: hypothetical protein VMV01_09590 [Planctomycetota bacterium]|jgi:hypothetical protein|nr:hypothetical protein [Planctomycetota bacterium]HZJ70628.1 hypothetical protein [Planctomycetota bacterium]